MEVKTDRSTPTPLRSTRRLRVRDVNSRFMTPVTSSSSSSSSAGDLHFLTLNSPKHNHHQQYHIQRSVSAQKSNGSNQLPMLSCRTHSKVFNNFVPSPFSQTLSSPLSSCNGREINSFSRSIGLSLPHVPPNSKIPADTKKQRKVAEQLEDVHSLKILHNRYLQWRFSNASTEVKTQAQRAQTETMLWNTGLSNNPSFVVTNNPSFVVTNNPSFVQFFITVGYWIMRVDKVLGLMEENKVSYFR